MKLEEKLTALRKRKGYSQEQLADKLGTARQTISKWENGQAIPELNGLIALSQVYGISIDRIVKEDEECNFAIVKNADVDLQKLHSFLISAKQNTYAIGEHKVASSRRNSHDYQYCDKKFTYLDSYLGNEKFSGSEVVWYQDTPIWSMNYIGRVIGDLFQSDFLKEALYHVPKDKPYRGPEIYGKGDYHYHCKVEGDFVWFQGYEEIFYVDEKIYECNFHGGILG